jgi:peroxiredoxin Q/BCP
VDSSGSKVSLADFAGRDLILYFYPKDDTPGCTKEACGFRDAWDDLQALGVTVLGVSADDAASHAKFASKYRLPFPLLTDTDRSVMKAYDAYGEKKRYGITRRGGIRSTVWIGPDGRVRRHWPRVSNAGEHPDKVLAAVRAER